MINCSCKQQRAKHTLGLQLQGMMRCCAGLCLAAPRSLAHTHLPVKIKSKVVQHILHSFSWLLQLAWQVRQCRVVAISVLYCCARDCCLVPRQSLRYARCVHPSPMLLSQKAVCTMVWNVAACCSDPQWSAPLAAARSAESP